MDRDRRRGFPPDALHAGDDAAVDCFLVIGTSGSTMLDAAGLDATVFVETEVESAGRSQRLVLCLRREPGLREALEDAAIPEDEDERVSEFGSCSGYPR